MIKIKSDKIITDNGFFDGYIYLDKDKIISVSDKDLPTEIVYDFTGKYVSPGFIDIHTHGGGGYSFIDNTVDDVINACEFHLKYGTTSIMPTITSAPFDKIYNGVANIKAAMDSKKCKANILGAHLEGPYFSIEQCGAQYPDYVTEPIENDYKKIVKDFKDTIKRWSFAPERDVENKFCSYLCDNGIVAAAGHTNAKYSDMITAINSGLNLITHLYSCTSTVTRNMGYRSLGVIETAFLRDELFVEIIADGKHLPPELINMIIKIKGVDKVALVTDSMEIVGTDAVGRSCCSGTEYIVEDGVCKLKDRSAFCGSIATSDRLVRVLVKDCGQNLLDAVKMITKVPSKIFNLNKGEITAGKDADLVVFDNDIKVSDVFVGGNKILF